MKAYLSINADDAHMALDADRLLRVVRQAGRLSIAQLQAATQTLGTQRRKAILSDLIDAGKVAVTLIKPARGPSKTMIYSILEA